MPPRKAPQSDLERQEASRARAAEKKEAERLRKLATKAAAKAKKVRAL